jgi:hypothetical protein
MIRIGLIRETKIPADNRAALIPSQCKWLQKNFDTPQIFAQPSDDSAVMAIKNTKWQGWK